MKFKMLTLMTILGLMFCTMAVQPVQAVEDMTCVLIAGSETYDADTGMHCALYNCPNGEQVQSCHIHPE